MADQCITPRFTEDQHYLVSCMVQDEIERLDGLSEPTTEDKRHLSIMRGALRALRKAQKEQGHG